MTKSATETTIHTIGLDISKNRITGITVNYSDSPQNSSLSAFSCLTWFKLSAGDGGGGDGSRLFS